MITSTRTLEISEPQLNFINDYKHSHDRDNRATTELYLFQKERKNVDKILKRKKKWLSQPKSGSEVDYAMRRY